MLIQVTLNSLIMRVEIVLYIDETIGSSSTQTVKMIQELNSKGVKVVNSLEELGGVLK